MKTKHTTPRYRRPVRCLCAGLCAAALVPAWPASLPVSAVQAAVMNDDAALQCTAAADPEPLPASLAAPAPEAISARSAVLFCPGTGTFLWEKDADTPRPMASTTKIMTALVAAEVLSPDEILTVPAEACGVEGSSLYLRPGEVMEVRHLLEGLLLQSANDAAVALALACDGSVEAFADRMNARAAELGLTHTHFDNPHGLDGPTHYTTARELALIAAAALEQPLLAGIVAEKVAWLPGPDYTVRTVTNHNKLLSRYEGACGVKTGFTKKAGRCLVSAARRGDTLLLAVTLSAPSDWADHTKLLDWGFGQVNTSP